MPVSKATLARKIRATVQGHAALVERDGTQDVPESFQFNFGGELEESSKTMRDYIKNIYNYLASYATFSIPSSTDEARGAQQQRNMLFAIRALFTLFNSPNGILRDKFQNRTYTVDDLDECIPRSYDDLEELEDISCIFQFKRHSDDENNPWVYSWLLAVEGIAISRGSKQPIHKLVTSLLKLVIGSCKDDTGVQLPLAELVKLKGTSTAYYWYLSNKNTTMYYHAFEEYMSLRSCMTKIHSFYSHTGSRQHPMDCYDDSPDWSMMMLSTKSPDEIIAMCDLVIANPDTDGLFDFPFLSRCLVLPATKEISDREIDTPYIFGKFYGNDKLINLFYDDSATNNAVYHRNSNQLLSHSYYINGGRINVIESTKEGEEGKLLLPYFDKANRARLDLTGEKPYWISVGASIEEYSDRQPVANCAYEYGSARFVKIWSPSRNAYAECNTFIPETFDTIFGAELEDYRDSYRAYNINGSEELVPNSMFVTVDGHRVLRGETTLLFDGSSAITASVIDNQERYQRIPSLGIFDLNQANHATVFNNINLTGNTSNDAA